MRLSHESRSWSEDLSGLPEDLGGKEKEFLSFLLFFPNHKSVSPHIWGLQSARNEYYHVFVLDVWSYDHMTLIAQTVGWEATGINRLILVSQDDCFGGFPPKPYG